jgi:hypothetical protein
MKQGKDIKSPERRSFIKKAGLGAGAVGAVALGLPETTAAADLGTGKTGGSGYRETDHVKRYYEIARSS